MVYLTYCLTKCKTQTNTAHSSQNNIYQPFTHRYSTSRTHKNGEFRLNTVDLFPISPVKNKAVMKIYSSVS